MSLALSHPYPGPDLCHQCTCRYSAAWKTIDIFFQTSQIFKYSISPLQTGWRYSKRLTRSSKISESFLTHWGRDKMDAISQTTFPSTFFLNENVWIPIKISLKFVPKGRINNIPALVQIMAWRRPGDKPLSEPMLVSLSTHICVTRPQWVKYLLC